MGQTKILCVGIDIDRKGIEKLRGIYKTKVYMIWIIKAEKNCI